MDVDAVLGKARPSTLEWLSTARIYVEFAKPRDMYSDVAELLQGSEATRWKF